MVILKSFYVTNMMNIGIKHIFSQIIRYRPSTQSKKAQVSFKDTILFEHYIRQQVYTFIIGATIFKQLKYKVGIN